MCHLRAILALSFLTTATLSLTTILPFTRFKSRVNLEFSCGLKVSPSSTDSSKPSQSAKKVHHRSLHRLKDDSDVLNPRALEIEERYVAVPSEQGTDIKPHDQKLLILRDYEENVELLRFRVRENYMTYRSLSCESPQDFAPILYLAAEDPNLVLKNRVMEVNCKLGLTGLLGTIAVGKLYRKDHPQKEKTNFEDDFLPTRIDESSINESNSKLPLPPSMKSLTLTSATGRGGKDDISQEKIVEEHLGFFADKFFGWREFDWRLHPRLNPVKPFYGGILSNSNNMELEIPTAKELARTVAHFLEPDGRFLHICQEEQSKKLDFLKRFLQKGYLFSLDEQHFTIESSIYQPQALEPNEELAPWKLEKTSCSNFIALLAAHHPDYDGYNGDYLFPIENGKF